MRLEDFFKKFLPSTVSPNSFENIIINFEQIGKICAGLLAVFYVVGIIISGLYYSSLNVRSIELFKVRYIFVGFYYILFTFLLLVYPNWWIKRLWVKIVYLFVFFGFIFSINLAIKRYYIDFLLQKLITGTSYFQFKNGEVALISGDLLELIILYLFLSTISISLFYIIKYIHVIRNFATPIYRAFAVFLIFIFFIYNYDIFAKFVFPYISDAIGGGKPPFVEIIFNKDVPFNITHRFDIADKTTLYTSPYYCARLIYLDNNSIFLKEPFWQFNQVFELRRSDIQVIIYKQLNPVEIGTPDLR